MIKDIIGNNESIEPGSRTIKVLKEHFPGCFDIEGKFDINKFKGMLEEKVDISREGYELNFLGKNYAKLLASLETSTVIRPNIEHNQKDENAKSKNVYISGDNLDALNHLLKSYSGRVKCIYIDPPYNTGTDGFVYKDKFDFSVNSLVDILNIGEEEAQRILDLTRRGSASDSAWLMFMYPRLQLASDLLNKDGVIFVSIDDNEQANLKLLMDDIFGVENFVAQIIIQSNKRGQTYKQLAKTHEYLLVYTKNIDVKIKELEKEIGSFSFKDNISEFSERELRNRNPKYGRFNRPNLFYPIYVNPNIIDENGYSPVSLEKSDDYSVEVLPLNSEGEESCWRWGKPKFEKNNNLNTMESNVVARKKTTGEYGIYEKYRKTTYKAKTIWYDEIILNDLNDDDDDDIWEETGVITEQGSTELKNYGMGDAFDFPKPVYLVKKALMIGADEDSICVDFFAGSATTAEAVMSLNASKGNREYILVQMPENLDLKYQSASASDKPKIQKVIDFLDSVGREHTLDQVGMERIERAAKKIKSENPNSIFNYGYKHFQLCDVETNLIDKMIDFDENALLGDKSILDSIGKETVLTTWLVKDGYGFNSDVKEIIFNGYTMYWCDKHLYLLDTDMTEETVMELIKRYDKDMTFNPENIVLFGYSFTKWTISEMLERNIKLLKDSDKNLKVNIYTRY